MHNSKEVDFSYERTKFSFHATYQLKNVDFKSKKGLHVDFTLTRDGKDVNFS